MTLLQNAHIFIMPGDGKLSYKSITSLLILKNSSKKVNAKSPAQTLKLPESPLAHLGWKEQQGSATGGCCQPRSHDPQTPSLPLFLTLPEGSS